MRIHVVGIGGIGMSGIAILLKERGYEITGSDVKESPMVKKLKESGIRVWIGHERKNVHGADVVVRSSAVKDDNVEVEEAKRLGIPVLSRAEILADIMKLKEGIAVAGTHGKTTTSSMIATVFWNAGFNPTILVGGRLPFLGGINASEGKGKWIIAEADESDGTFLKLIPTLSVITNIDSDHLDFYKNFDNLLQSFVEFANRTAFYGKVFLCGECENVLKVLGKIYKRKVVYGFSESFDLNAKILSKTSFKTTFEVKMNGKSLGAFTLNIPGKHNILNALACIGVSVEAGVPLSVIRESLENFKNAKRRMEIKGTVRGITFVDDYAHHPTEMKVSYTALKDAFPGRRIVVLFQPHRFSRVKMLWEEFVSTLKEMENVFLTDIYPAGEKPIEGVSSEKLAMESGAEYLGSLETACRKISKVLKENDVFVSMGAGDVTKAYDYISEFLTASCSN